MRIFSPAQAAQLLPYPELAAEIAAVLAAHRAGGVYALERATAPLPAGGTFLAMPAADAGVAMVKVGSVKPHNASSGLPTVQAAVVVLDAQTGSPVAVLDGATVTTRRTAALSLLGLSLAPRTVHRALVIGAGVQAAGHVESLATLSPGNISVYARRRHQADDLALAASASGIEVAVVTDLTAAVAESDVIITTTNATQPILRAEHVALLRRDVRLVAVGAFRPGMAELDAAVVEHFASNGSVVVDTLAGAIEEAGELIAANAVGAFSWDTARELVDCLAPARLAPDGASASPLLVKTVGHSLFDLAAARLALRLA